MSSPDDDRLADLERRVLHVEAVLSIVKTSLRKCASRINRLLHYLRIAGDEADPRNPLRHNEKE